MNGQDVIPSNPQKLLKFAIDTSVSLQSIQERVSPCPTFGHLRQFAHIALPGSSRSERPRPERMDSSSAFGTVPLPETQQPNLSSNDTPSQQIPSKIPQQINGLALRVRWNPSAGKLLRHQHGLPGAAGSWCVPQESTTISLLCRERDSLGIGIPLSFLEHPESRAISDLPA